MGNIIMKMLAKGQIQINDLYFYRLGILYILVLFPFMVSASISYTYNLDENDLRLDTIQSPEGTKYIKFAGGKFWSDVESGHPDIPCTTIRFLVPDDAYDFTVNIARLNSQYSITNELPIFPKQNEELISDFSNDTFIHPNYDVYESF